MILKINNKGSKVQELQRLLGIEDDGTFGKETLKVVKEFQTKNGLLADGVVGPKTWELLLKDKEIKVEPIFNDENDDDNISDPEEKFEVEYSDEEYSPVSKYISELINLINSSNITRKVSKVVFHCTATNQNATVSSILEYWKKELKWNAPGYHIIVKPDGSWTYLLDFNKASNGVANMNSSIINISYIGGVDKKGNPIDNRTKEQKKTLETVYRTFKHKMPNLTYHGHYEFSNKACPSFNVQEWIKNIK